jgi:hypothetical protein
MNPPKFILSVKFDLIIFHTTFISLHFSRELFISKMESIAYLKNYSAIKIALPQDEFINTDLLCEFINNFNINHVFSVAPPSEWAKIYPVVDRTKVQFHEVLTGYLDEKTICTINKKALKYGSKRDIDIGYRAYRAEAWLGRHGILKTYIADKFLSESPKYGLKVDLSTNQFDKILGDDWFDFLLKCKYTLGVEGGSSILDTYGTIRQKTEDYSRNHPDASFDEIESACFPGADGSINLFAISPRHLEACATKTCQVLIEGEYNGILNPGIHYLELKRDFRNIFDIIQIIKNDSERETLTERAYCDIILSGKYSYQHFVNFVLSTIRLPSSINNNQERLSCKEWFVWKVIAIADRINWVRIAVNIKILTPFTRHNLYSILIVHIPLKNQLTRVYHYLRNHL